jgi:hypothetical protein
MPECTDLLLIMKTYMEQYPVLGEGRLDEKPLATGEGRRNNKMNRINILRLSWRPEKRMQSHLASLAGSGESPSPRPVTR